VGERRRVTVLNDPLLANQLREIPLWTNRRTTERQLSFADLP